MTREAVLELDDDQRLVAEARIDDRLFVIAGPGSGKTETVSARIEYLRTTEDLGLQEVLVISFSRAAVEAVQRRQRLRGTHASAWVSTVDALVTRILIQQGVDPTGMGFDARIVRLMRMLQDGEVDDALPDVRHVIVDEVQDVVGVRARLIAALLEHIPPSVGFTMLGDPKQGIYDFQLEDPTEPDRLLDVARELGADQLVLSGQYRAETRDAERAMALRGDSRTDLQWANDLRTYVLEVAPAIVDLENVLSELPGTIALLTHSNAQALTVARDLHALGIQAELLARSVDRSIDPWLAEVFGTAPSLTRDAFLELVGETLPIDAEEAWSLCRKITESTTRFLNSRELARRLATGYAPVALNRGRERITVSTVHRAKGLEFDYVLMLDPETWYIEDDADLARVLYVAITRPRRRLFRLGPQHAAKWWRNDRRTDRAYKPSAKGRGTVALEIRGADWRGVEPPGADDDPAVTQDLLRYLADRRTPLAVDIVLNPFDSTMSQPSYDAFVDGMKIGTLGPAGTEAFVRAVGRPTHGRWPRITGAYFTGLETVAGPIQQGPVGGNGLWLSPLIGGPAHLDWSAS